MAAADKIIIGLVEKVLIIGKKAKKIVKAKIDTGATKSSIDSLLAETLGLGPILKSKIVKTVHGKHIRPVVEAEISLADKTIKAEFTLADRGNMRYPVLIGQNILIDGFIIDPSKTNTVN